MQENKERFLVYVAYTLNEQ